MYWLDRTAYCKNYYAIKYAWDIYIELCENKLTWDPIKDIQQAVESWTLNPWMTTAAQIVTKDISMQNIAESQWLSTAHFKPHFRKVSASTNNTIFTEVMLKTSNQVGHQVNYS